MNCCKDKGGGCIWGPLFGRLVRLNGYPAAPGKRSAIWMEIYGMHRDFVRHS
jgi:hypothetical protein